MFGNQLFEQLSLGHFCQDFHRFILFLFERQDREGGRTEGKRERQHTEIQRSSMHEFSLGWTRLMPVDQNATRVSHMNGGISILSRKQDGNRDSSVEYSYPSSGSATVLNEWWEIRKSILQSFFFLFLSF